MRVYMNMFMCIQPHMHVHVHCKMYMHMKRLRNIFWKKQQLPGIELGASDFKLSVLYHLSYGHRVIASLQHMDMYTYLHT